MASPGSAEVIGGGGTYAERTRPGGGEEPPGESGDRFESLGDDTDPGRCVVSSNSLARSVESWPEISIDDVSRAAPDRGVKMTRSINAEATRAKAFTSAPVGRTRERFPEDSPKASSEHGSEPRKPATPTRREERERLEERVEADFFHLRLERRTCPRSCYKPRKLRPHPRATYRLPERPFHHPPARRALERRWVRNEAGTLPPIRIVEKHRRSRRPRSSFIRFHPPSKTRFRPTREH